jgi:hypothetical protein
MHTCITSSAPVSFPGARGHFGDVYYERPAIVFCGLVLAGLIAFALVFVLASAPHTGMVVLVALLVALLLSLVFLKHGLMLIAWMVCSAVHNF